MDTNIIEEVFENSKTTMSLVAISTYRDDSGFWTGYVKEFNEEFVQLHHYTKYGKSDGTVIEKITNIESIEFEDDYVKCLAFLIRNSDKLDIERGFTQPVPTQEDWQFDYLNFHLGQSQRIIRIELDNEITYSGFVTKLDKENVILQLIGELGNEQSFSMYKLEDIISVRVNDIENRKRLMLYNWKKSQSKKQD